MSFDHSPRGSNAHSSVASMSPPAHRTASPSDDGRSSNASRAPSSQDPYYSNEDIAALHAVVVAAQELLDTASEPKPLPAAALFKAYDAVLPTYGIDPDTDHHLSTFVFRVGGERGDGTLLDKFQTILGRMGIVLEFGENTTASSRTSPSASPAFSSTSRQSNGAARLKNGNLTSGGVEVSRQPSLPSSSPKQEATEQDGVDFSDEDEPDDAFEEMRKKVLSSAMNRWRSLVAKRGAQQAQRIPSIPSIPEEASVEVRNFEDRPFPNRPAIVTREASASPKVNGVESYHQPEGREPTELAVRPLSSLSFSNRPTTASTHTELPVTAHTQTSEKEEIKSRNVDNLPRYDEDPTTRAGKSEPAPSHHSPTHPEQEIPAPLRVNREDATGSNDRSSPRPSTPPERTQGTSFQHQSVQGTVPDPATPVQHTDTEKEHRRLLRRASRAREIYLASKVFNHWADRTARRLERDAVARRHMIRFRYFRSWSQAPAVREPTVEHMRAAVAIKKWRRITGQEKSLEATAKAASRAYELKKMLQVLDRWSCLRLEHVGRQITASRNRTGAISRWMSQAFNDETLNEAIKAQAALRHQANAIHKWQDHTEKETARADTAVRIGNVHQSFTHLREWWDQAEISRRAAMYRQHLLIEKATFAFDQWNLQARAQAFIWRREYLQVTRVFDRWCERAEQDRDMGRRAEGFYEQQAKSRVLGCFHQFERESSHLIRLEDRARLYLGATSLLRVFDRTVKHSQDRDKQYVKRYLMARYTQVSSARKRRNFFAALDRWRRLAAEDRAQNATALELQARIQSNQRIHAVEAWAKKAFADQRRLQGAKLQHARGWLDAWKDHTSDLEERDAEAWQLWAVDKQRYCLKSWSIASLQQSGQAHTALEVKKKHERERRNRVLQQWRQRDDRIRRSGLGFNSQPTPAARPPAWPRGSWRGVSVRRSLVSRSDQGYDYSSTPLETPTRWTGQLFSMSSMIPPGSMAPLREADENDAASSLAGDDDDLDLAASPSLRPASRGPGQFSTMPSTTPMAPLPSHLERDLREQYNESGQGRLSRTGRPSSRLPRFEVAQPSLQAPRQAEMSESPGLGRLGPQQRPLAATRSFGFRQPNRRTLGPRPNSPESSPQPVASKSVGARSSGPRYGAGQAARFTPATRSVRLQAPRTFSITAPRPAEAPRRELSGGDLQHGRINTNQ
ncbi:hypothetical protein ACJZ2D_003517 [Fusarium nematophilum]